MIFLVELEVMKLILGRLSMLTLVCRRLLRLVSMGSLGNLRSLWSMGLLLMGIIG